MGEAVREMTREELIQKNNELETEIYYYKERAKRNNEETEKLTSRLDCETTKKAENKEFLLNQIEERETIIKKQDIELQKLYAKMEVVEMIFGK